MPSTRTKRHLSPQDRVCTPYMYAEWKLRAAWDKESQPILELTDLSEILECVKIIIELDYSNSRH